MCNANHSGENQMNIFVLDQDPIVAAQMHVDKHCVKMILELTQQLTSAVRKHGATDKDVPSSLAIMPEDTVDSS